MHPSPLPPSSRPSARGPRPLLAWCLAVLGVVSSAAVGAPGKVRREVAFPDLPGYTTLRCDFHMHTVFSDGLVWPTLRVEEAWRDGLDVIALTDHNEYQRFKDDVPPRIGRSYELALPTAQGLGLLLIRAGEITRAEPPGHLNALFLQDVAAVQRDDSRAAVQSAAAQGAFLFWNHPGWKQPERKSVWYAEQEEFLRAGWLKGLEVVNGPHYDPIVHGWAVDKSLTLLADSDVHDLIAWRADYAGGQLRPMTLVFAREKTEAAVKEALFARRTVVFANAQLCGDEALLGPLVQRSLELLAAPVVIKPKGKAQVQLRNRSAVPLQLSFPQPVDGLRASSLVEIPPGAIAVLELTRADKTPAATRTVALPCVVGNALTAPGKPLRIALPVPVQLTP